MSREELRLEGKTAIVTGGAHGIGRACCEVMAREGAKVAITDVESGEGKALADQISSTEGQEAVYHDLDVRAEDQVTQAFTAVKDRFGGVDILVNNAGVAGPNKPTDEISVEEWQSVMDVNVKGVFLCTKHAIPLMREAGGGSIVNLSSIYGLVGAPDLPPYHASKGAVRLMTKTDALFYAEQGIRVNSVHPGYIWTPLVKKLAEETGTDPDEFRAQLAELHPMGRVGQPEEIANGVLFLASDESSFMTGSELVIDGGYTAR